MPNTTYVLFYALAVVVLIALSDYCTFGIRRSSSIERIGAVTSLVSAEFAALTAVSAAWAMKRPLSTL